MPDPKYTQEELDEKVREAYEDGYRSGNALYTSRNDKTEEWYRAVILELSKAVAKVGR
jgi:hypothetical protein